MNANNIDVKLIGYVKTFYKPLTAKDVFVFLKL